nr:MAG TPA: hypothetical protein [Bacteriophage sp.]
MSKVRRFLIFKSSIKAADNSRFCFICATYLSYAPKGNIKSFGIISKLCDVNTNISMGIAQIIRIKKVLLRGYPFPRGFGRAVFDSFLTS